MKEEDLLGDPVEDVVINASTTLGELHEMMKKSGGFMAPKVATATSILRRMFSEDNVTFLSFPADIISTGTRGLINQIIKNRLVDAVITTTGTLDHDIARSLSSYYGGSFDASDSHLRSRGINRLGNVFIPDSSYGEVLEKFTQPVLEELYAEKREWGCSEIISKISSRIGSEDSLLYNASRNGIPVFVPGITDGSFGSQLWSFYERNRDFKINLLSDEHELSDIIFDAKKTGALMIGGGISKHHTIWWNQFRDGLDYAVYVTTAQEYDGSLSGARLEEAISWGKIRSDAEFVNVYGDATVILPLILGPLL